ncbi:Periplasmic [NiFeSe] hydrogenase large subunit [Clostridium liquoris]|uniref:Periplasmic [NiFeSe] hydrogenase large subunit n=1 Tax=Clostridium liquoris TaxID=1289519 RepID=A0A2T0B3P0_9CLOT|nr:nickel-dependent hydrogenase large subunit [Clostridium liquoris]PRR78524.1 Periplasmic [NiFeSe] hydrogenase large subunit [Clostridium liquoris]
MSKVITIDPITRMSGFLEITAKVEGNLVIDASTSGLLFRGFEKMLRGRSPLDAIYFTERICGICSTAHGMASTLALEDALKVFPNENDKYIRDILHGFEFLQNHIRHFYLYVIPSYVKLPDIHPISPQDSKDFRLPNHLNERISKNYIKAIEYSRLAHEGLAVLGGKAPHNHGIFVGGVTVNIDAYKLEKVKSIISKIKEFSNVMLEDAYIIAKYYPDYFKKGITYPYFMSYGVFNNYHEKELIYANPGVSIDGKTYELDSNKITENIHYAWYISDKNVKRPGEDIEYQVDISKKKAYTFIKAPRYEGLPMQVGPLARLIINGEYKGGNGTMDRIIARAIETKRIAEIMEILCQKVEIKNNNQEIYSMPDKAYGVGLIDTTRGALGHWVSIENKVIKNYDIITPTMWNLSPKDEKGLYGTTEKALVGTEVKNTEDPIELGRIARAFDPCVSCATHVIVEGREPIEIRVL